MRQKKYNPSVSGSFGIRIRWIIIFYQLDMLIIYNDFLEIFETLVYKLDRRGMKVCDYVIVPRDPHRTENRIVRRNAHEAVAYKIGKHCPLVGNFLRQECENDSAYSGGNAEDVTLFDRVRRRAIALYASPAVLALRGATYNEDELRSYDVIDYNIDTTVFPDRQFIEGKTQLTVRVQADAVSTLTLPPAVWSVAWSGAGSGCLARVHGCLTSK